MKILKMLLTISIIVVVGLVSLGLISWFVDHYFYSWTANTVRPFGCKFKYIRSPFEFSEKKLKEEYDLFEIVDELKTNPDYKIEKNHIYKGKIYILTISRILGDSSYRIKFDRENYDGGFIVVNYGNFNQTQLPDAKGEPPDTPKNRIRRNINRMINEMPLNNRQKKELKGKVEIKCKAEKQITIF